MGSGKGALMVERTLGSQSDGWGSGVIAIRVRFSCAKSDIHIMASMMPLSKVRRDDGRFAGKMSPNGLIHVLPGIKARGATLL